MSTDPTPAPAPAPPPSGWLTDNWKFGASALASALLVFACLGVWRHFANPTDPAPEPVPVAVLTVPSEVKFTPGVPVTVTAEVGPAVKGPVVWYVPSMCKVWSHTTGTTLIVSSTRESPFAAAAFTTTRDGIAGPFEVRFVPDKPVPPGPVPPVPPGPNPPKPPEPPTPAPIPTTGLRVLMVHESTDDGSLTPSQREILFGTKPGSVKDWCKQNCAKGPDGKTPECLLLDKDDQPTDPIWKEAMARPHPTLPWLIVSNGKTGWEGPLGDMTAAQVLDLLKKHKE